MRKLLQTSLLVTIAALVAAVGVTFTPAGRVLAQNVNCFFVQGGSQFVAGAGCTVGISGGTLVVGGTSVGAAATDQVLSKAVAAIADNTATTVLTVTVPNAAHAATIPIVISASLGAGGAIGADECTATGYGQIVITRTAGVATVATATTISNTGSACVAGATTETLAYSVTAMTGAVGATQTFNVQITVARGGGSSTNHTALIQADVLNANAAGITVS